MNSLDKLGIHAPVQIGRETFYVTELYEQPQKVGNIRIVIVLEDLIPVKNSTKVGG